MSTGTSEIKAIAEAFGGNIETTWNQSVVLVPQKNGTVVVIGLGGVALYANIDAARNLDLRSPLAEMRFQPHR